MLEVANNQIDTLERDKEVACKQNKVGDAKNEVANKQINKFDRLQV